jgi:signal transduction histidine kinase
MPAGSRRKTGEGQCPLCLHSVLSERHIALCTEAEEAAIVEIRPPEKAEQRGAAFEAVEDDVFPVVSAAHEFKTPLVVMLGYTELLRSGSVGAVNDKQQQMLGEIQESAERLQRVIQDLLLLCELRAAKGHRAAKERRNTADVNFNMKELFEYWAPVARQRAIEYRFCPAKSDPKVAVEPLKLQHIVSNLIENALNFTPGGGQVVVSVVECFWDRRKVSTESLFSMERRVNRKIKNAVCIIVSDTGPGIAPDHHEQIFADFVQLPGACARGTGLGLAIARRLVEAHRGVIWVESELGKGSKFLLLLSQTR